MNRNKKIFFIATGIVLLVLALGFSMYLKPHRATVAAGQPSLPSTLWKTFEGTNPPFNFVFEYPVSWTVKETKLPGVLNMVQVMGPQDKVTNVIPAIYIKVKEFKSSGAPSKFSGTLLKKEGRFKKFKKLYEGPVSVAGMNGSRLSYQYVLPLPMRSMHARDTVMRREEILLVEGEKPYQISSWATEEQFKNYQVVLEHILKTFQFKK